MAARIGNTNFKGGQTGSVASALYGGSVRIKQADMVLDLIRETSSFERGLGFPEIVDLQGGKLE